MAIPRVSLLAEWVHLEFAVLDLVAGSLPGPEDSDSVLQALKPELPSPHCRQETVPVP